MRGRFGIWLWVGCAVVSIAAAPLAPPSARAAVAPGTAGARAIETSLTDLNPVEGGWHVETPVTIHGRVFTAGATMDTANRPSGKRVGGQHAVFTTREGWDRLEAWVGFRGDGGGTIWFVVLGDGEEIYRSPRLGPADPAVHVSVPVRGYSGVTLLAAGEESTNYNNAAWAEPRLIRLPAELPVLVSPGASERVHGDTPLVWKGGEHASGYLLELQCERLATPHDPLAAKRFLTVTLSAGTTVYSFPANTLPKGRWRWRVHSLSPTGFLAEMEHWQSFVSEVR